MMPMPSALGLKQGGTVSWDSLMLRIWVCMVIDWAVSVSYAKMLPKRKPSKELSKSFAGTLGVIHPNSVQKLPKEFSLIQLIKPNILKR
jgi:hypothetical protein